MSEQDHNFKRIFEAQYGAKHHVHRLITQAQLPVLTDTLLRMRTRPVRYISSGVRLSYMAILRVDKIRLRVMLSMSILAASTPPRCITIEL